MRKIWLCVVLVLFGALLAVPAEAHGMRSAYLEITETTPGHALVHLSAKVPDHGLSLRAPDGCTFRGDALDCPGPIAGRRIAVDGMGPLITETAVLFTSASGETVSTLLTAVSPESTLEISPSSAVAVARRYVGLGWEHIWTGADHLLFLLGLVLVLKRWRAVLWAETAFTCSHSISFSAAALGWVHVSSAAAEACIALSLVLVAIDVGKTSPGVRHGALLAFVFGLVHGLGFAGGLSEIGLPDRSIPSALLGFAGGVEIGQVTFLALAVGVYGLLRRFDLERAMEAGGAYAVGGVGSFWLLERALALGA